MEFLDPWWERWEFPPWMIADLAAMGVVKNFEVYWAEEKEEMAEKAEEEKAAGTTKRARLEDKQAKEKEETAEQAEEEKGRRGRR